MKRKLKQICAFVLLVSMIFSGFTNETVAVSAAETDSIVSGECGENVYYELNTTTGVLRIYGTGPMADYGSYTDKNYQYAPWVEKYASIITKVKIENGVTSIGDYAFCGQQYNSTYHCVNLDSVDIANSVMRIGKGSFWGSSNLKTITIPSGVEEIEFGAFCGTALTDIQWGDSIVTIGESAFWGNKFTDLNLPLHIQNIGTSAFGRCRSLKSVKIPANCEVGYQAFEMCEVLESVKISDNCEVGYQAFKDCEVLESVEFGNNCKIHGGVFEKCALLNSITIGEGSISVRDRRNGSDYGAFRNCTGLQSILLPDSWDFYEETEEREAYDGQFSGCDNLKSVQIKNSNKKFTMIDGVIYSKDKKELYTIHHIYLLENMKL